MVIIILNQKKKIIDNDCALIPLKDMPNNNVIKKYKVPSFKDWSSEIGI